MSIVPVRVAGIEHWHASRMPVNEAARLANEETMVAAMIATSRRWCRARPRRRSW